MDAKIKILFLAAVWLSISVISGCKSHSETPAKTGADAATSGLPQPSATALLIVERLHLNPKYASLDNSTAVHSSERTNQFETVIVAPPAGMSDGFTHTIRIDHKKQIYWILRTGGFAGVHEEEGPFEIEKSSSCPAIGRE